MKELILYFKGSPKPYKYNADKVTFLTNPLCLAPEQLMALIAMVKNT